ncbi:uncharacterized protein LACBIDRAFT_316752 [Laccaria bicolor S238N-H82]|uniref:Predicted protein n=1 Tax=Laccaria bicolor (strain S238N-H82 / ATCC MYA-4686) TaxID=486041 RepID=B0E1J7_LACBS|nr:uncharacterized protein LACBIDRAFT_316752 [Laccaria bicolor S238N-H82]EDQ99252.1 predicted protein [Laccaria bicolor S238N-H82]|eukprot:XP_001890062.1 predicted protein [Laccaria bicolor S238N-H82]
MPPKGKGPKGTLKPSVLDPLCTFCGLPFKSKGITQHQKSCKSRPEAVASDARSRAFEEQVQQEGLLDPFIPVIGPSSAYTPLGYTHTQLQAGNVENSKYYLIAHICLCYPAYDANIAIFNENETINNTDNNNTEPHGEVHTDEGSSSPFEQAPQLNDIKVEYHPRSGRQPQFFSFDEYKSNFQDLDSVDIPVDPEPWKPFRSRLDFELAELILDTHMNKNQTNELISLIHRCILDPKSFTLKNEPDLSKIWENAANRATKFEKTTITVEYNDEDKPLEFVLDGFQLAMQLQEDSGETGKKKYVNFKRVVWHKAFYEILKSVEQYAETGYHLTTADIERWMFPIVLIASADYEEQCIIALIRGVNSKFPCPVCLIPGDQLANLSSDFPLRFSSDMEKIYKSTIGLNASETEETLKNVGLRDVENVFWKFPRTDIHRAISWDRLHAYHGGLFSDHIWEEVKSVAEELGKGVSKLIDTQVDALPTWSGLNHFTSIIKTGEFADGSKYEDMLKVLIFALHNIFTKEASPRGYQLLKLLQSYVELDMYASLKVHTETTIQKGREELLVFEKALHEYMPFNPAKSWSFPKAHTHKHMFDDIQRKGVTRNYNTKPNEKCHGAFKNSYKFRTNFKNVAPQILKFDHADLVATVIRDDIDYLDLSQAEASAEDSQIQVTRNIIGMAHVSLGSQCAPVAFSDLEDEHSADSAFKDFHKKIGRFFTRYLGRSVRFGPSDQINPFQLLRVNYESKDDWCVATDLLRANPKFHGKPRYDCIIVKIDEEKYIFACLLYIFGLQVLDKEYHMALILPMDLPPDLENRGRDNDLRFNRVKARHHSLSVFISVESIIRGGLLATDYGSQYSDEYLVMDMDSDM